MPATLIDQIIDHNKTLTQLERHVFDNITEAIEHISEMLLLNTYLAHKNEEEKKQWISEIVHWLLESLRGMFYAKNVEEFKLYQDSFNEAISHIKVNSDEIYLQKLVSICKTNIDSLATSKLSVLENVSDNFSLVKNFGWIGLGAALIIVGIVIPPIAPVTISLGVVGLGYGIFDFAKEASEPLAEKMSPKLGKREKTISHGKFNDFLQSTHKSSLDLTLSEKNKKKKVLTVAGLVASGVGLLSGLGSLLAVIPALSLLFPPALPFVLVGIGLAAAVGAATIYGYKYYQERKKLQVTEEHKNNLCTNSKAILTAAKKTIELDTTALTEKALLGVKANEHLTQQQQQKLAQHSVESKNNKPIEQPSTGILKSMDHTLSGMVYAESHPQDTYHKAQNKAHEKSAEDSDGDGEKDGGAIMKELSEVSTPSETLMLH